MRRFISPTAIVTMLIILAGETWFWANTDSPVSVGGSVS